jgi:hypothetical protein
LIKTRKDEMARAALTRGMRNACNILVRKPEGKTTLGRLSCKCEENIKVDTRDTRYKSVNWFHLARIEYNGGPL